MADDIARYGPEHPFTALVPDLSGGVDPDDAFSKIPYEKVRGESAENRLELAARAFGCWSVARTGPVLSPLLFPVQSPQKGTCFQSLCRGATALHHL